MFKLSLDALLIIDAIDRLGSFAAAANALYKVPSTISYTVSKLEGDLGVKLFERYGPKVTLTEIGQALLKEGRPLLKSAEDLEQRMLRAADGWEAELRIGMDSLFCASALIETVEAFQTVSPYTQLKFYHEVMSGTWEALLDHRVDLLIGAVGDGPSGGGYTTYLMGTIDFMFVVAPQHPLAQAMHTFSKADLALHTAIVVSDSVRQMQPRTVGLLDGQKSLTVSTMRAKLAFQLAGIGFGFMPAPIAQPYLERGQLIEKKIEFDREPDKVSLAWRQGEQGNALKWWVDQISKFPNVEAFWQYD